MNYIEEREKYSVGEKVDKYSNLIVELFNRAKGFHNENSNAIILESENQLYIGDLKHNFKNNSITFTSKKETVTFDRVPSLNQFGATIRIHEMDNNDGITSLRMYKSHGMEIVECKYFNGMLSRFLDSFQTENCSYSLGIGLINKISEEEFDKLFNRARILHKKGNIDMKKCGILNWQEITPFAKLVEKIYSERKADIPIEL